MLLMIFSVCLRTGSNPADINLFRSYTGNFYFDVVNLFMLVQDCHFIMYRIAERNGKIYTSLQSFMVTFLFVGITTLGTLVNFDWLAH